MHQTLKTLSTWAAPRLDRITGLQLRGRTTQGVSLEHDYCRFLGRPRTVFDVGAHEGESLRDFLCWFPQATIHCFEPARTAFSVLAGRASRFPNVTCHNLAMGSVVGNSTLFVRTASLNSSLKQYPTHHSQERVVDTQSVQVATLDMVTDELGVEQIDLLKVDTEGGDLDVLLGARKLLENQRVRLVQVEAGVASDNHKHVGQRELEDHMTSFGYQIFGLYDQTYDWPSGRPLLRRVNIAFINSLVAVDGPAVIG